jgi:hypothetical protein
VFAGVTPEKEVIHMQYFKIVRAWEVKAENEAEAFRLVATDQQKYLKSESVTRTEYKKPQPKATGLVDEVMKQVLGS